MEPTALYAGVMALLDQAAEVMANQGAENIDLTGIDLEYYNASESPIFAYLVERVRALSGNRLALRPASPDLFGEVIAGNALYLAVCPGSYAGHGRITEKTDDMLLYRLGPYRNGLHLNVSPKS